MCVHDFANNIENCVLPMVLPEPVTESLGTSYWPFCVSSWLQFH